MLGLALADGHRGLNLFRAFQASDHPMTTHDSNAYVQGVCTARQAIAEGVPRWICISDVPFGQMIDPGTGLPIAHLSAPVELADWQTSYAQGFNDEISSAIALGEVTVDFRPLLMTRPEVVRALSEHTLGTLSPNNPRLDAPNIGFVLELRLTRDRTKPTWIRYRHSGEEWPEFAHYEGPLDVAVGRDGRVLVLRTSCLLITHDVATTQVLATFPL